MNYCQISYPSCSAASAVHGVNARVVCLPRIAVPCPPPHSPVAPPFLLFCFWLEIVLDHFNTFCLCPIGRLFQMEGLWC